MTLDSIRNSCDVFLLNPVTHESEGNRIHYDDGNTVLFLGSWVLGFMKSGKVRVASSALNYQVCGRRARMGPLQSGEEMGMLLLPDGITSLLDICATLT